jgi:calmodulin
VSLGQNPTEAELNEVVSKIDSNHNGTIEFDEIMELVLIANG